ncbi:hypothetical protein VNI00_018085 [Paramarasmius palmivorus]|uniref:Protein kinase domain-containing protein n=1 Tax=Paramarasmius palmivorus TaxID=297713 RepID=A0AAW0B0J8_9AGAR
MNYQDELNDLQVLFRDEEAYKKLLAQEGPVAQSLLDWLQQLIDAPGVSKNLRASICQTMVRLSKRSSLCPGCLTIRGVTKLGEHPVAGGGFGDIWKGHLGSGQLVCLKVVKVYLMSDLKRSMKEYLREAIIWRQLRHPNVLPCLGLYYLDDTQQRVCLVSPWMDNGNLVEYIRAHPRESVNHVQLMHDITSGLSHLHALKIVHGDLKGFNVLITRSHRACLADFGLSHIADSQVFKVTSTVTHSAGTARWSAPEIHTGASSSTQSDIYSVGCLFYEIVTGLLPFHNLPNEAAVLLAVLRGLRPEKPEGIDIRDWLWSLMNDCWATEPVSRPTAENLLQRFPADRSASPTEDWDGLLFNELQRNVAGSYKTHSPLPTIFQQDKKRRLPLARMGDMVVPETRKKQKYDQGSNGPAHPWTVTVEVGIKGELGPITRSTSCQPCDMLGKVCSRESHCRLCQEEDRFCWYAGESDIDKHLEFLSSKFFPQIDKIISIKYGDPQATPDDLVGRWLRRSGDTPPPPLRENLPTPYKFSWDPTPTKMISSDPKIRLRTILEKALNV